MSDETEAITETAKAVQETAKLGTRALDVAHDFGAWVAAVIGGPVSEGAGIVQDELAFIREKNRLRFQAEYERLKAANETRAIPANLGVPLIQAGMLEEDSELQNLWVAMLANATDPDQPQPRRSYVSILKQLDSIDVLLLRKLYAQETDPIKAQIPTYALPERVPFGEEISNEREVPPDVEISLRNLMRVGLLDSAMFWSGAKSVAAVHQSPLG